MTVPTRQFFDELANCGHVPWLENEHGRPRFELADEDCVQMWTVAFDDGQVTVDQDSTEADGVLRADRAWFERAVTGEAKRMPAALRGRSATPSSQVA
jgi:SCP-2 sterol transfer family